MNDSALNIGRSALERAWKGSASPYPGLRPFDFDEADIFFGRERHCDEVLSRLATSNFVSVIGPSGCGKSSLLKAGVMHQLKAGRLYSAGSRWRLALMRPENKPSWNLAVALDKLQAEAADSERGPRLMQLSSDLLLDSKAAFDSVRARPAVGPDTNILLVVDQFEELFKAVNEGQRLVVEAFIGLLLQIHRREVEGVHCILTMRSDHLGDCSAFPELADVVNKTFYLTPNLTESEIRDAIELPVLLPQFDGGFDDGLIDRICKDMSEEPADQLPLMQHVLMQMWSAAKRQPRTDGPPFQLTHALYEHYGPLSQSLGRHADWMLANFKRAPGGDTPIDQRQVQVLFRQLTERRPGASAQDVRRPTEFGQLASIAGLHSAQEKTELAFTIDQFRGPDALFLQPFTTEKPLIDDDTRIDIVHECLIRKWPRLREWVQAESEASKDLKDLADKAASAKAAHGPAVVASTPKAPTALPTVATNTQDRFRRVCAAVNSVATRALGWGEVLTARASTTADLVRELVVNPEARTRVAQRTATAPGLAVAPFRRRLQAWGLLERRREDRPQDRYLDPENAARFELWRRGWDDGRLPNAAWAANYKIGNAAFQDALAYLTNSRKSNRWRAWGRLGVGALSLSCLVFGTSWLLSERQFNRDAELNALAVNARMAAALVKDENLTAEKFAAGQLKPEHLAGDRRVEDWVRLQRHVIESGIDLAMSRQPAPTDFALAGITDRAGMTDRILQVATGRSGRHFVVRTSDEFRVYTADGQQHGGSVPAPRVDEHRPLDVWVDDGGRVAWLDPTTFMLHSAASAIDATTFDIAAGMKVEKYAVAADYSRIALIAEGPEKGSWLARILDPGKPTAAMDFVFELPEGQTAVVEFATFGGPNFGHLAASFYQEVVRERGTESVMRVSIWDISGGSPSGVAPLHDFYSEFGKHESIALSPDGSTLAFVNMPILSLHILDDRTQKFSSNILYPSATTYQLLNKGNLLATRFTRSKELVLVTDSGKVLVWPFLVRISTGATLVQPQLQNIRSATFDVMGRLYAALRDVPRVQRLLLDQHYGRFALDGTSSLGSEPSAISAWAADGDGGRLVIGRSDGQVELRRLLARSVAGASTAGVPLEQGDNADRQRKAIIAARWLTLADRRSQILTIDEAGGLWAALESRPGAQDFALRRALTPLTLQIKGAVAVSSSGDIATVHDKGIGILRRNESATSWTPLPVAPIPSSDTVCSLAFSPAGLLLVAGTAAGAIFMSPLSDGAISSWTKVGQLEESRSVESITVSTGGDFILAGAGTNNAARCTNDSRSVQRAVVLHAPGGNWGPLEVNKSFTASNLWFSHAQSYPGGNTFLLTAWKGAEWPAIEMLDVEPLRFGKTNVDDDRRPLIDLEFIELLRSARGETSASLQAVRPGSANRSDGAAMACDKTICWLIVPHSKPGRFAITTLRHPAQ